MIKMSFHYNAGLLVTNYISGVSHRFVPREWLDGTSHWGRIISAAVSCGAYVRIPPDDAIRHQHVRLGWELIEEDLLE